LSKHIVSRKELDHVWYTRCYEIEADSAEEAIEKLKNGEEGGYIDGKESDCDACIEIDEGSYEVENNDE